MARIGVRVRTRIGLWYQLGYSVGVEFRLITLRWV